MDDWRTLWIPYTPHAGQIPFHRSRARIRILACGRRWGKDRAAAAELLRQVLLLSRRDRGLVPAVHAWVVAPTLKLLRQAWREVERLCPREIVIARRDGQEPAIRLAGDAGREVLIEARSAHRKFDLVSVGLDMLTVTEAARISRESWYEGLRPCLSSPRRAGRALLNSTPRGMNWFHDEFQRGRPGSPEYEDGIVESWNHPSADSPLMEAAEIEQARRSLPELTFRQEYGAEFIDAGGAVFHGLDEILFAGELAPPEPGRTHGIGIDLGRLHDATAVAVLRRPAATGAPYRLVHYETMHAMNWSRQIERIERIVRDYPGAIAADNTGIGQPVCEALRARSVPLRGVTMTVPRKRDVIDGLSLAIEQKVIQIPDCARTEPLIAELRAFAREVTGSGHEVLGAPSGAHDDGVIALALALDALGREWLRRRAAPSKCWLS